MLGLNLASFMFKSYTNPEKNVQTELLKKLYSAATDMSKGANFYFIFSPTIFSSHS